LVSLMFVRDVFFHRSAKISCADLSDLRQQLPILFQFFHIWNTLESIEIIRIPLSNWIWCSKGIVFISEFLWSFGPAMACGPRPVAVARLRGSSRESRVRHWWLRGGAIWMKNDQVWWDSTDFIRCMEFEWIFIPVDISHLKW
jgi:hypothetical protein